MLELVHRALDLTKKPSSRRRLLILRAEIGNHGLGMAHTQVRLNSTQIHNAIRKLIDMEGEPDDPTRKRTYLASLSRLLTEVKPMSISFARGCRRWVWARPNCARRSMRSAIRRTRSANI